MQYSVKLYISTVIFMTTLFIWRIAENEPASPCEHSFLSFFTICIFYEFFHKSGI